MAALGRTFRVFVSSTFSDLKAERNALQNYVFPRLRELSQQYGARFQPIDLRWGVSSEASLDQQAMQICLDEIKRCRDVSPRPNFLILMGDRYGWLPPLAKIPQTEFEVIHSSASKTEQKLLSDWYELDLNADPPEYRLKPRASDGDYKDYDDWQPVEIQLHDILARSAKTSDASDEGEAAFWASATHQEIISGALRQKGAREHVFCFIRNIQGLPRQFDFATFKKILSSRIARKYPQGIPPKAIPLHESLIHFDPSTSPKQINDHLKEEMDKMPDATREKDFLKFVLQALTDFTGKDYINLDETTWDIDLSAENHLGRLKEHLQSEFEGNIFKVDAVNWIGDQSIEGDGQYHCVSLDHIGTLPDTLEQCKAYLSRDYEPKNLCEASFQHLGNVILAEVAREEEQSKRESITHFKIDPALDLEGIEHLAFAETRIAHFVGRETLLREISQYIQQKNSQLLAVAGEGGSGKSAVMAKALQQTQAASKNQQIIFRFIGATPASSDGRTLLDSLCHELARRYDRDEDEIPADYLELVSEFDYLLSFATQEKPLVLFLDSLDQLSAQQGIRNLNWLPDELPDHVSILVSTRNDEDTYTNLLRKQPIVKALAGLSDSEGASLLDSWLKEAHRKLTTPQNDEVLAKFKASKNNPLYLKLAFEEARLWTSYQAQEELAEGVRGIIRKNMFDRLSNEGNHGEILVSHALGYLAASRFGLSEDELVDLLSRDPDVYEWFFNQTYHLPSDLLGLTIEFLAKHPEFANEILKDSYLEGERLATAWLKQKRTPPEPVMTFIREVIRQTNGPRLPIVLWSRLSFDLAPYLTNRTVDTYTLLSFFHREIGEVAKEMFLSGEDKTKFHSRLAQYFQAKADPNKDGSWSGNVTHAISELPYHLTEAGERDTAYTVLTDFTFLEQKVAKVGITERKDETGQAIIHSDGVHQLEQDFKLALEKLYGDRGSADEDLTPLILTAMVDNGELTIECPVCGKPSPINEEDLGQTISCPNNACPTQLKINPFVIEKAKES